MNKFMQMKHTQIATATKKTNSANAFTCSLPLNSDQVMIHLGANMLMCSLSLVTDCKGLCTNRLVASQINYHVIPLGAARM